MMMTLKINGFAVLLAMVACVGISACSSNTVRYDIEEDSETGILYNLDWEDVYNKENAYFNKTNGLVNILAGPGYSYDAIAYLKKGEGGFIQKCNFDLKWCLLNFGGQPDSGWVNMEVLSESKIEYTK